MISRRIVAAAAACTFAGITACDKIKTSNCIVQAGDVLSTNYRAYFSVTHTTPQKCPVQAPGPTDYTYTAYIYADAERAKDWVYTRFYSYYGKVAAPNRADPLGVQQQDASTKRAYVNGFYTAGLDGCAEMYGPNTDYAHSYVPVIGLSDYQAPNARVQLSYVNPTCPYPTASVQVPNPPLPDETFTVTAYVSGDPVWTPPVTYKWTLNGQPLAETGATLTYSGSAGAQLDFGVTMQDDVGNARFATGRVLVKTCYYEGCNDQ